MSVIYVEIGERTRYVFEGYKSAIIRVLCITPHFDDRKRTVKVKDSRYNIVWLSWYVPLERQIVFLYLKQFFFKKNCFFFRRFYIIFWGEKRTNFNSSHCSVREVIDLQYILKSQNI